MWEALCVLLGAGNAKKEVSRIVRNVVFIRLVILAFIIIVDQLIEDYDTSTQMVDRTMEFSSYLDWMVREILRPFSHWDAVYFAHVGEHLKYAYEHMHAFFPVLPMIIYAIRWITRM